MKAENRLTAEKGGIPDNISKGVVETAGNDMEEDDEIPKDEIADISEKCLKNPRGNHWIALL